MFSPSHSTTKTKFHTRTTSATHSDLLSSVEHCSTSSLPFPLLSPLRAGCRQQTSSPPASRSLAAMHRSRWADSPPTAPKGAISQSAAPSMKPSTSAVQPVANPGALKLKKSAVKILGAASHLPPPSTPSAASIPLPMTPPVSLSDKLEPLVAESLVLHRHRKSEPGC